MMSTLAPSVSTLASRRAIDNLHTNRSALARSQPGLVILDVPGHIEWVLARDGSLTARDTLANTWLGGVSVPHAAARELLRTTDVSAVVSILLYPTHPQQILATLDRLQPHQAIQVVLPDAATLALFLGCCDFSDAISRHRLFFLCDDISAMLESLHDRLPGLPLAGQFVRLVVSPTDRCDSAIASLQSAIGRLSGRVAQKIELARRAQRTRTPIRKICLIAPSRFRLWHNPAELLAREIHMADAPVAMTTLDTDNPLTASPLALAQAVAEAHALVAADLGRGDLAGVVDEQVPWICWATTHRIPRCVPGAEQDVLLLADASLRPVARRLGWPDDRIHAAGWPVLIDPPAPIDGIAPHLLIAADTRPLDVPADVDAFSSHAVLWTHLAQSLLADPFILTEPAERFIARRARMGGIDPSSLPMRRFIDECVTPAFMQGIARALIGAKLPVVLAGRGWSDLEGFHDRAAGAVEDQDTFVQHIRRATAVVNVWADADDAHPVHGVHRPVLHLHGRRRHEVFSDARSLLAGHEAPVSARGRLLCAELIDAILG